MYFYALLAFLAVSQISAEVHFEENFNDSKYWFILKKFVTEPVSLAGNLVGIYLLLIYCREYLSTEPNA